MSVNLQKTSSLDHIRISEQHNLGIWTSICICLLSEYLVPLHARVH